MYTLTRKLSVVCLTVVLSFLVYGCGGSSKQALITDVTDMVMGDLMPEPGTYPIEPGGTANAGDVSFTCPEGGPSCEVTVADDGTIVMSTSAEGTVIAMDSDLAIAKAALVVANMRLTDAEAALVVANMRLTTTEDERVAANMRVTDAEAALVVANMRVTDAEAALVVANMSLTDAERQRDDALKLAEQRTMVTTIVHKLAAGYDDPPEDVEILMLDPREVKILDHIKVTCAADIDCVLVVTIQVNDNDDSMVTYTSLGGVVKVENSDAVVETRAAIALHQVEYDRRLRGHRTKQLCSRRTGYYGDKKNARWRR